ncbi:MAG TPA: ATP synthase subunit I [Steroidobacteraceae bacterium]|nr:ATP synthase subunit I [Steroidobacteraceae bacterium]
MGDGRYVQIEGNAPSFAGCGPVLPAMSAAPVRGYRLVARIVLLQAGCTVLVASLFFAVKGSSSALAALAGGLVAAVGSALFGWRAFAPGVAGGAVLSRAMYAGKALQWVWYALALYVAFGRLKLEAGPLLIGLVTAQFGYWAALLRLR